MHKNKNKMSYLYYHHWIDHKTAVGLFTREIRNPIDLPQKINLKKKNEREVKCLGSDHQWLTTSRRQQTQIHKILLICILWRGTTSKNKRKALALNTRVVVAHIFCGGFSSCETLVMPPFSTTHRLKMHLYSKTYERFYIGFMSFFNVHYGWSNPRKLTTIHFHS